ncbi:MAG: hypothetical protein HY069_00455 [Chlamydiia bacterium]|nr:hypothetical protein [Chlamydiia bacterium]
MSSSVTPIIRPVQPKATVQPIAPVPVQRRVESTQKALAEYGPQATSRPSEVDAIKKFRLFNPEDENIVLILSKERMINDQEGFSTIQIPYKGMRYTATYRSKGNATLSGGFLDYVAALIDAAEAETDNEQDPNAKKQKKELLQTTWMVQDASEADTYLIRSIEEAKMHTLKIKLSSQHAFQRAKLEPFSLAEYHRSRLSLEASPWEPPASQIPFPPPAGESRLDKDATVVNIARRSGIETIREQKAELVAGYRNDGKHEFAHHIELIYDEILKDPDCAARGNDLAWILQKQAYYTSKMEEKSSFLHRIRAFYSRYGKRPLSTGQGQKSGSGNSSPGFSNPFRRCFANSYKSS